MPMLLVPLPGPGVRAAVAWGASSDTRRWSTCAPTGLIESRVVQGALECLADLGWLRPEAVRPRDGGRPGVRFHTNPRLVTVAMGPARGRRSPKVAW